MQTAQGLPGPLYKIVGATVVSLNRLPPWSTSMPDPIRCRPRRIFVMQLNLQGDLRKSNRCSFAVSSTATSIGFAGSLAGPSVSSAVSSTAFAGSPATFAVSSIRFAGSFADLQDRSSSAFAVSFPKSAGSSSRFTGSLHGHMSHASNTVPDLAAGLPTSLLISMILDAINELRLLDRQ